MTQIGNWTFTPLVTSFPSTVFPNVALWNVTNGVDLNYQIQLAWPLNWTERDTAETVETMYVLDGNALGMTATENWRRRQPVEFNQPNSIVVSIGYPLTDAVYSAQRSIDFQPPFPANQTPAVPGVRSGADDFIKFIDGTLRPWVRDTIFPSVIFDRDALYAHSFGGLFVLYALLARPDIFDVFISSSPALYWNNNYIFSQLYLLDTHPLNFTKPAFRINYGSFEQYPIKRRVETEAEFEYRLSIIEGFNMTTNCQNLYQSLKNSTRLRDIEIKEYVGSDHAAVAAAGLGDGIDYFLDWPGLVQET